MYRIEIRKEEIMFSKNAWDEESTKYYVTTITIGDTELEIYGEVIGPDPTVGYLGEVDIDDVRIVGPDGKLSTSIWELANQAPCFLKQIKECACENLL